MKFRYKAGLFLSLYALILALILHVTISGSKINPPTHVPYAVLEDRAAFPVSITRVGTYPNLIVLSELADVEEYAFAADLRSSIDRVDFDRFLILLIRRGEMERNGTVKEIRREGNKIVIKTRVYHIGLGQDVLPGHIPQYQIIRLEKELLPGGNLIFFIVRESGQIGRPIDPSYGELSIANPSPGPPMISDTAHHTYR